MREYDDLPHIVIERERGGMVPFLWGALLGAGVALLLAPRSGAETQQEIRDSVQRLRDTAGGARDRVVGTVDRTRTRLTDRIGSVRDTLERRTGQARDAVDAGRRAARDARTELERRLDQAKAAYRGGDTGEDTGVTVTEVRTEGGEDDGLS